MSLFSKKCTWIHWMKYPWIHYVEFPVLYFIYSKYNDHWYRPYIVRASTDISKDSMLLQNKFLYFWIFTSLKLVSTSGKIIIFSGIRVNLVVNKVSTEISHVNYYMLWNPFIEMSIRCTILKIISFDYGYLDFENIFYRKF